MRLSDVLSRIYVLALFLFVFLPILTSVVFSFNSDRFPTVPLGHFTTHWYETAFSRPEVWTAFGNSLIVAVCAAALSTMLGFVTAYTDFRYGFRFKSAYLALALLPPTIPLVIMGLAMLAWLGRLGLSGTPKGQMTMGAWHPVSGLAGVFASAIQPRAISPSVLQGPGTVNALDGSELSSTVYLVAFDLSRYDLGYAVGTQDPNLKWSPRPPGSVRAAGLPGPDGVSTPAPLAPLGMVSPNLAGRTVATFAGGFKRRQGAFKWGPFATVNGGSHYGFVEQGVIFSKLQPGLSTLYALKNGPVQMKTWTKSDNGQLSKIRFARQNGVALIEGGVPGRYVTQWGAGNWSGSADAKLRTLRAGACMITKGGKRFLAYAYFPSATPSVMARTFQAYGCSYAMLLDMNAPELTYLALYVNSGGTTYIEHMVPQMAASDKRGGAGAIPKFLGATDSRDMFYVLRKR